jgi:hypothetical protein
LIVVIAGGVSQQERHLKSIRGAEERRRELLRDAHVRQEWRRHYAEQHAHACNCCPFEGVIVCAPLGVVQRPTERYGCDQKQARAQARLTGLDCGRCE